MEIYGYIAAILMGLSLGLIGGGGSILTVPILVYLFSIHPVAATSQSLFVVGATALVGTFLASRRKEVNFKTGLLFAVPSFGGVYLTKSLLLPRIPEELFSWSGFTLTKALFIMSVFAILMLMASLAMILRKAPAGDKPLASSPEAENKKWSPVLAQGFLVGSVTGLVGAGGGFLIVP
ncbi:MAG: sulfite exporter TauE/SafE family protein, partial [Pseudobdellovibrionaceae bacterium]